MDLTRRLVLKLFGSWFLGSELFFLAARPINKRSNELNSQSNKQSIGTSFQIVVNTGPFATPGEAANAEHKIDWNGNDHVSMNACTESYAAQELRRYLRKILQVDPANETAFPVVAARDYRAGQAIFLTNLSDAISNSRIGAAIEEHQLVKRLRREEAFALVRQGKDLLIIGYDRRGTLYGVYHLLEILGVRWYAPGKLGEVIQVSNRLNLPAGTIIEEPKFITRGFWAWENRGDRDFYVWMARNRLNFWTLSEPDRSFLKKLGIQLTVGGHIFFNRFLNSDLEYPFDHRLFEGDEDKPPDPYLIDRTEFDHPLFEGDVDSPHREYRGDLNKDGKLTYMEAHPEWYGLVAGKRQRVEGVSGANICTSNRDAVAELSRKLVQELVTGEWQDADTVNFWPMDAGYWCECRNCKALGTPTDRLLLLVHHLRQAIVEAIRQGTITRNLKIIFPIYTETLAPPTRPLPEGFDYENCIGTLFPIRRCYAHVLNDASCTEFNRRIWSDFLGWTKQEPRFYKGRFFVGEYYNISFANSLPVLYTKIMMHDIRLYYEFGVRHGHYMHVYTGLLGFKRLNNYLFAKLLWDPYAEVELILDRYFTDTYEDASNQMGQLYKKLEYATSSITQWKDHDGLTGRINGNLDPLFNTEHLRLKPYHPRLNEGVALLESVRALQQCRETMDSLLRKRWTERVANSLSEDDRNLRYAENTVNLFYQIALTIQAKRRGNLKEARDHYLQSLVFADSLQSEVELLQTASSHANANNGMEASGIQVAYERLGRELGVRDLSGSSFFLTGP